MTKISPTKPIQTPSTRNQLMYVTAIVTVGVAILTILGLVTWAVINSNQQEAALDKQTENTEKLLQEVKNLTEDNKKLNQTAVDYTYCNAVLLAKYTQTLTPITIQDLEKCILLSFPSGSGPATSSTNRDVISRINPQAARQAPSQNAPQPSGGSNTPNRPTTPQTPQTPSETPQNGLSVTIPSLLGLPETKLDACINVLGIKTC